MNSPSTILTGALMESVIAAVREAGELLCGDAVHEIHAKSRTDFVTDVDFRVQSSLRARLGVLAPEVQFMGEEQDNSALDPSRPFWILDPVDGTTNLIHGLRRSAVSLALADGGETVFGVIWNPYARELFTAVRGGGAFLNGVRIHVSPTAELASSLVYMGTAPGRRDWSERVFRDMRAVYEHCIDIRRGGSACLALCDVACGRAEAYAERWVCPWDHAAGALIVSEAGGRATDCSGAALSLTESGGILASNGAVHGELLAILR